MSWRSRAALRVSLLFGAAVLSGCTSASDASSTAAPTWYRDVQPIVSEHCASCHEPGGVGTVVLDFPASDPAAYDHAKPVFADAVNVLDADFMPWWLADRSCRHYEHERLVGAADKQVFRDFVAGGSQRGDPADTPPAFVPTPLGRVDAKLSPSAAYLPVAPAPGIPDWRCFVLDPTLTAAKDVVGFGFSPGSRRVHRAALFSIDGPTAQALDQTDPGLGYACAGGPGAAAALVGEYVPGVPPQEYPSGTGVRLPIGSLLVLQIGYDLLTGDPEPDRSEVDLEYADAPVLHPARFEAIGNGSFSIPALATGFQAMASFAVKQSSTLWGVAPHLLAHGRQAHMSLSQSSAEACLIEIANWDPTWEQDYFFADPASIPLVPGDSIAVTCTWDNPGEVAIVSGTGANDEACIGYAYLSQD